MDIFALTMMDCFCNRAQNSCGGGGTCRHTCSETCWAPTIVFVYLYLYICGRHTCTETCWAPSGPHKLPWNKSEKWPSWQLICVISIVHQCTHPFIMRSYIQPDNCIILGSDLFFVLPRGLHVFLKTLDILTPESILRKQKIRNHVKVVHESNALHCQSTFLLQNFNLLSCAELLWVIPLSSLSGTLGLWDSLGLWGQFGTEESCIWNFLRPKGSRHRFKSFCIFGSKSSIQSTFTSVLHTLMSDIPHPHFVTNSGIIVLSPCSRN